ncbi:MAG: metal-dependent transcriptional regulator, partial [Clostridia bacterium]|nr:metal-dependent transcriptional regulator [Clostridia bacterium]
MKLNRSGEDYLKAILALKREKGNVRSSDIAKYLNVTRPSV